MQKGVSASKWLMKD